MKFTFTNKQISLPENVHAYAEKKAGKLERYFKGDVQASVVFSVQKNQNKVEMTVRSGSTILRVAESTSDMFASIDAAVASVERQIRKHKARLEKSLRNGAFERSLERAAVSFVPDTAEDDEFRIARTKRFPLKPMVAEEAILQMNLLAHTFFAFRNQDEDGAFSVVYRREDGDYGLIIDDN